ncbi:MAG: hypothetical protein ACT4QC_22175 [Planctomycetaceae bacterium]
MFFRYGSYTHDQNECAIAIGKRAIFSPRGIRQALRETWHVTGIKHAASQAELTAALAAMRAAYSVNGLDAGLYLDDGATLTDHALFSSATLGGVRVVALDFPEGAGAEYSTFRTYRLTLEADFPDTAVNLLEYDESLSFEGTGGPRRVFLDVLEGLPQEQIGTQRTTYRAVQEGRAVGYAAYPTPPPPVWPGAELFDRRRIVLRVPERRGNQFARFTVEWHYAFESIVPLTGTPHIF